MLDKSGVIPYFLISRRISLISPLSAGYLVGLSTRYEAHFAYKHIYDP
jgi:hypothetical protein